MSNLVLLIKIGGVLHLEILSAGITMTKVLEWKSELQKLGALTCHVIWVHGAFIFLVIAGFGMVSLLQSDALAGATPLGRPLSGFIALFWGVRLVIQFFLFDARPYLTHPLLKLGYHGLTVVFTFFVVIYAMAALAG